MKKYKQQILSSKSRLLIYIFFFEVIKDECLNEAHCSFKNLNGIVTLHPISPNSICSINNVEVKQPMQVYNGKYTVQQQQQQQKRQHFYSSRNMVSYKLCCKAS